MSERSRTRQVLEGSTPSPASAADWLYVGTVGVLVVVDGLLGVAYAGAPTGRLLVAVGLPADLLWWAVGGLGVCAAVAASAAAGLRSPTYAAVGVIAVPAALAYWLTGLVLPWDQLAFWIAGGLLELVLSIPVAGDPLAGVLFGGRTLGSATLRSAFRLHYGILAVAAVGAASVACRRGWRRYAGVEGR